MAFTKEELDQYRKIVSAYVEKRRPPVHLRDKVDLASHIEDQSVFIFEIRAVYNDPQRKIESPIAKATWVRSRNVWHIYWTPSDMKWNSYDPLPEVKSLQEFINAVEADENACFYG